MILNIIRKYRFFLLLTSLFLFFRLPSLFEPNWYGDEGIYLVLGQAIRKGLLLYSQIHDNKPPTLYYLAAFGQTVFGFRLLLLFWMIPTIYVFYLLSKKFFTGFMLRASCLLFLVFTNIPLFEGHIANAEIFMLLPTILGIYLFYSTKRITYYLLLITGLLLGFAFTIKIPVAVEFGFLCVWLLITNFDIKKIKLLITYYLILFISFLLPFLLYLIYFYFKGSLDEFMFAAIFQNFGYLSSWATGSHSGSATSSGIISRVFILLAFWIFCFFSYRKKIFSPKIIFLSLWFSATIFGVLLSTRPYPHYLIQSLPPLILIIVSLFDSKLSIKIRFYFVVLFLFLVSCFFKYHFYVYPVISYYQNFYSYSLNLKSSANYQSYFGNDIITDANLASFIENNTSDNEKIFVWGDHPFVYSASNRLPVGRFTVAYHIVDFQQYEKIYEQLTIDFPQYIIYYPQENRPYPQLDKFISRYYRPSALFGSAIVYQRQ